VAPAEPADLHRMRELVTRTNQLCAVYSDDELEQLRCSPRHACLLVSLRDRFGDCGKVGLALMELAADRWTLKLLLFSCRVASRGVSELVLGALLRLARAARVRFLAELVPTSKNQPMLLAYRVAGFEPIETRGDIVVLEHPLDPGPAPPGDVRLELELADAAWPMRAGWGTPRSSIRPAPSCGSTTRWSARRRSSTPAGSWPTRADGSLADGRGRPERRPLDREGALG